jgi:hypothetical protein
MKRDQETDRPRTAERKLVQMRLKDATIQEIEELQTLLGESNRTDTVVRAVQLAKLIAEEVRAGKQILLKSSKSDTPDVYLRIPGLNS